MTNSPLSPIWRITDAIKAKHKHLKESGPTIKRTRRSNAGESQQAADGPYAHLTVAIQKSTYFFTNHLL